MNKKWFYGIFIFLIPLISLLYNNLREFIFIVIIGTLSALITLNTISFDRNKVILFHIKDYLLFIFCCILLISTIYSASNISDLYYLKVLIFIEMYILVKFFTMKEINFLHDFIIISGTIQSLMVILQFLGVLTTLNPHFLVTGLFLNPNYAAVYVTIPLILCLYRIVSNEKRNLNIVFFIVMIIGLLLCRSRSAILSTISAFIIIFFYSEKFLLLKQKYKRIIILFLCVFIFSFANILYSLGSKSADSRILIWRASIEIIKEHPFIGSGAESFKTKYMFAQAKYFNNYQNSKYKTIADNNYQSYNEFIRVLCEQGVLGLLFFLVFIFVLFKNSKNRFIKAIIVSIAVNSFFLYTFDILSYLFMLPFVIQDNNAEECSKCGENKFSTKKILISLLSVCVLICSFKVYKDYSNSYNLIRTSQLSKIKEGSKAYKIICRDRYLALNYAYLSKSHNSVGYNLVLFKKIINTNISTSDMIEDFADMCYKINEFDLAENYYILSVKMIPGKIKSKEKLLNFYISTNKVCKAKQIAEEILNSDYKVVGSKVLQVRERARQYLKEEK